VKFTSNFTGRMPDQTETHLFRIAQEALTNVARHAEAKTVRLSLDSQPDGITLRVEDDGRGFVDGSSKAGGMGMIGMRARARSASGDVSVHSQPGRGVVIEVQVPHKHETDPHPAG
jgi:signal transduction histidine kinase